MIVSIFISGGGSFAGYAKRSPHLSGVNIKIFADRQNTKINKYVDTFLIRHENECYWDEFDKICAGSDLVFLNFNYIVPENLCRKYYGKIINQHPSLLPSFKGLNIFEQILKAGVKFSGSTFHFITPEVDCGPVICQTIFPVLPDDSAEDIKRNNYFNSRDAYVQVIKWFDQKRVMLKADRVILKNGRYNKKRVIPNLEFNITCK
ncbi:MAG: formyltransferase family protein [Nitrospira sp.]|nr:formyltransferase family protein [Nitrospira sp.]